MPRILKKMLIGGWLLMAPLGALAEDLALVIANHGYRDQPALGERMVLREAVRALKGAGFTVFQGGDLSADEMIGLATRFRARAEAGGGPDRVVIVLGGHVVSSPREAWLLGRRARRPDTFTVGRQGLPLGPLLDIAARAPGQALVMIAAPGAGQRGAARIGEGLEAGAQALVPPQGVMLVEGPARELARFLSDGVLVAGTAPGVALDAARGRLGARGFISRTIPFLPAPAVPGSGPQAGGDREDGFWEAARAAGTIEALLRYVERYPQGRYLHEANRLIGEMRADPLRKARAGEEALGLTRERRRQIQRDLSILGYDPRGIDGIFGRGTRAAIAAWQRDSGFAETGYLTGNQITALRERAGQRARELEEEARRRQAEQDRLDVTYWRQTGRGQSEEALRAYLRRYPDGLYAEIAQARLDEIAARKRAAAAAEERRFWEWAEAENTPAAYRDYLRAYPEGAFAQEARDRLEALAREERSAAAREEEARVARNPVTRLLIEQRLQALGYKPGRVDGKFDEHTRRALRKFQRSRQLPATGYVTQKTIVRLLSLR